MLGVEGAALFRAFAGHYDRDFTEARLAEVRALLGLADRFGDGAETRPITAGQGYRAWAENYDQPGNGLNEPGAARGAVHPRWPAARDRARPRLPDELTRQIDQALAQLRLSAEGQASRRG
ncbi:MAG: hypothetical protein ACRDOH_10635 [Streptosporangiaceae bacterium]